MNKEYIKNILSENVSILNEDEHIVEGVITDSLIDIDGHIIDQQGFKNALGDYLAWGNIRDQHGLPVGKVVEMLDWNKISVQIVDDSVWKKIRAGLYKGFSIGIRVLDIEVEDASKFMDSSFEGLPRIVVDAIKQSGVVFRITKMVLGEVSIVDRPANPRALITTIKSLTNSDAPYMPIIGSVLKAQNEGENQMSENTQQVQPVNENTQATEVQATEDKSVDFESRIASLEKSVNDLVGSVADVVNVKEEIKTLQDSLTKALEALAPKVEVTKTEEVAKVDEVKVEDADKVATVDVEKQVSDAVSKALEAFATGVDKKVDEALAKFESHSPERVGGVNGGSDETAETQKSVEVVKSKATYKDVAMALASKIGLKE